MGFFSGEYDCTMDAKGRIVLPARIKSNLPETDAGNVVVTRGFENCLVLYGQTEFKKIYTKIAGLNEFSEEFRRFQRNFFRGVQEVELDNNSRLLLPKSLASHAQIDKDVIVVGMGNRVEIWNPTLYETYLIKDSSQLAALAEKYLTNNSTE
ncbi:MAG: division/cell wall cluster transcriptional repressor MraZ [Cytophagaceae bacterium]|jgi:MraZ protein|nr:division/cell wall cluster transcriptional repressor MraZ [Cytophagaceae bacterium]